MRPRGTFAAAIAVFLLALVVRLVHVLALTRSPYFSYPIIDAEAYDRAAQAIASGNGHPDLVFWQPPGYAYFLAGLYTLFGRGSLIAPRIIQAFLGALSSVLVAWIGLRLFSYRVGLAAGLGTALYGTLIYFDGELLTPSLTITMQLIALSLAIEALSGYRPKLWFFAAGLIEGFAAVVTATSLILVPVLAVFARRYVLFVLSGAALAILPVTLRNYVHGGEIVLISSNAGINLYIGNNPRYDETVAIRPGRDWIKLVSEPKRHGEEGASASSRYFIRKVGDFITTDPLGFLALQLRKLYLFVGGDEIYRSYAIYPARIWSPVLGALLWKVSALAVPFGVLLPLGAIGIVAAGHRAPLLAVMTVTYAVAVIAFFVAARYRAPVVPLLRIFAAEGVRWFIREADRARRRMALVGGAALFALANVHQGEMSPQMNADAEFSLGARLSQDGREREALALYQSSLRQKPDYMEAWVNLGVLYARSGLRSQGEEAFRQALELEPDDPDALTNLANLRLEAGETESARRLYEAALRADPSHRIARSNLAKLLKGLGH